jgi:hypothetical protein
METHITNGEVTLYMELKDGIYHVRTGNNGEKLIQVPKKANGHYWRYIDDEINNISTMRFIQVKGD